MTDHDQRFKVLLREFFAKFIELILPHWVARFDFTRVDWLDKEVFPDPPQGERRALDLVARLPTRSEFPPPGGKPGQPWLALIHGEIESAEKVAQFRRRMFEYYDHLRWHHDLPVLPVALYLRVGLDGIGWEVYEEFFWDRRIVHFEYAYIGLPALDAEQYVNGENILGAALAALMRVTPERRAWLKEQALQRISNSQENDYRRYLLFECVDAYLPLEGPQLAEFEQWLRQENNQEVQTMAVGYLERARQEGALQDRRETLLFQLEARFGPLNEAVRRRVQDLPAEQLRDQLLAVLKAQSLQEMGLEGLPQGAGPTG